MDPFNSNQQSPAQPMPNNQTPHGDPKHGHKKRVLQQLVHTALGQAGRSGAGVHDVAHGIKTALSAYKNYAKEWDTLHGTQLPGAQAAGMAQTAPQAVAPKPIANLQRPPISQQMMQPGAPVDQLPPALRGSQDQLPPALRGVPDQNAIAPAMPAFMGGGRPAGY